ncbi:MAG: hypothetical protein HOV79_26025 [Hamadaea sp.]|nr:hypothetical protein [Hamadaea sp.]
MAKLTANTLAGAVILETFPGALVSVDRREEDVWAADIVCWNGSALSGGGDVVWVWQVAFPDDQSNRDWNGSLDRQMELTRADPLTRGRPVVPGPECFLGPVVGANVASTAQVVVVECAGPGRLTFDVYEIDRRSREAAAFLERTKSSVELMCDVEDEVETLREALQHEL